MEECKISKSKTGLIICIIFNELLNKGLGPKLLALVEPITEELALLLLRKASPHE